ncbi:DUF4079 domain-containing protein [Leptolyngbya sp. FACHB-36]|uniref:DUF4079 domain-containing protein n=1 Tax=Leptolyngbya sp. FACHB-36 TaxID=2692808 RepID=UPI001680C2DF|nr:DUF4079 domain-containing protein [Leptolyngbya sp. FACHB-36]MBD2022311.1 DUF4079 domain-containing protein [Leptolyngbya sp. FACHB-36]
MYLGFEDVLRLVHPAIAVLVVFPLLGMVVRMAWQTRQRRLETAKGGKSKIPPVVGQEHLLLGRWLTGAVVGVELLGITRPLVDNIVTKQIWSTDPFKVAFIGLLYIATISSLVLLFRAQPKLWRGVFATLSGMGVVILSLQDGIYRRDEEWYASHLYSGILVTLLMIFALAIVPDIYRDRSNRWRVVHIVVNCVALLFFVGQGLTGTRDLLEIPLSWQEQHIYKCDYPNKLCPEPPKQG